MRSFIDQIGHQIELSSVPKRIVSVVPSQTELLYDLGLSHEVVGITKFCVHPNEWFRSKQRIGGTKKLHLDQITALNPDLIIANKEENTEHEIKWLQEKFPVYTSDVSNLNDSIEMIQTVGAMIDKSEQASQLRDKIKAGFTALDALTNEPATVLYLIWKNPYMSVGQDTFIHDMLKRCKLTNVCSTSERYPELSAQQIKELAPEFIFLSSEPFPFKAKHMNELKRLCDQSNVILVDGEYFSWYGSRLAKAPKYFRELLNKIQ